MLNIVALFKEFLSPFAWFLSLGKEDADHIKSEVADLLHHSSQSLKSLIELSQTLEDIPRSDFSKARFGPIANHCWWFFTTDRGIQQARTHCTDIQRDVARINFKMAKILRTENRNWKGINDAFGSIMDADRVYLHNYEVELSRIGRELSANAFKAIALVLVLIVAYIAIAFRKVSRPLASWKYGVAALVALFHDVIIPLGLFAVLGRFYDIEISSGFIAAILTVLGYSVHDSIIVFDRIRENLIKHQGKSFDETIDKSVNQTFTRSLNTSLTVILVLLAIYFLGGESMKYIALVLMVGIGVGTYSSIFIGSTLLVSWNRGRASARGA